MATPQKLVLFLIGMCAFACSAMGQKKSAPSQATCKSAASCNLLGTEALKKGNISAAVRFFKAQVGYAEDARDKVRSTLAYNNVSVAYLRNHDYFRALTWTHLALRFDPENKSAKFNLDSIQQHLGDYKWPSDVGGVYAQYAGRTQWNSFCPKETEDDKLHFRLLVFRMGQAWREYGPASYGDVEGDAILTGNGEALYQGDKDFPTCRIKMRFSPVATAFDQEGDCGFGYGVRAAGDYERISATATSPEHCGKEELP